MSYNMPPCCRHYFLLADVSLFDTPCHAAAADDADAADAAMLICHTLRCCQKRYASERRACHATPLLCHDAEVLMPGFRCCHAIDAFFHYADYSFSLLMPPDFRHAYDTSDTLLVAAILCRCYSAR